MTRVTLKPSDLEREARRLLKAGKMPTLQQVLDAIDGVGDLQGAERGPVADFDEDAETMLLRNRRGGQQ
jgi:hypothetical protein